MADNSLTASVRGALQGCWKLDDADRGMNPRCGGYQRWLVKGVAEGVLFRTCSNEITGVCSCLDGRRARMDDGVVVWLR